MSSCPTCGTPAGEVDAFCGQCGARLTGQVELPTEVKPAEPLVMTPPLRSAAEVSRSAVADVSVTGNGAALPVGTRDSELLGEAGPNEQYLGQRLLFKDGEAESLDPLSWRFLKALFAHWVALFFASIVGGLVVYLVFGVISTKLGRIMLGLFEFGIGILVWWAPVWAPISEWKFMLDGKSNCARPAFEHIAWAFIRRSTPVTPRVQRLHLGAGASRDYLFVRDGFFCGYVVSLPYGCDLYVGWTYWWRLSAIKWLWIGLMRTYHQITLRGSQLHSVHRYDSAKALREAIHGAAREGLDAATGVVAFEGAGTVGSRLPIEEAAPRRLLATLPGGAGLTTYRS